MLTKKDLDALDQVQSGQKQVTDTHLAPAAEPATTSNTTHPEHEDGSVHIARDFGEALVDVLVPGAGSGETPVVGVDDAIKRP